MEKDDKMAMEKFHKKITDIIGDTPIIKLNKVAEDVESEIYVKLEYMNPGGSIKDRIGCYILEQAVKRGDLKPGGTIIEGTSGNTGVGLAMWAAVNGYRCIFVLADKQSMEKINNLKAFGAKVVICPTNVEPDDPRSYYSVSARLAKSIPNSYYVNQYDNEDNGATHFNTTGPEILRQTEGKFDVFMAGVGTGGTISGTGSFLKSKMPDVKVVGVDIEGSILAHYHKTGEMTEARPYVLEGLGEDMIPGNVKFKVIDDFVVVEDKESFLMTRSLLIKEGIYAGGSSGAAVVGALKYARTLKEPKKILVILPDSGNRYQSKIYNDEWMRVHGYADSTFNVSISEVMKRLGKGEKPFISINDKYTVGETIELMKDKGISQVPVYSENDLLGIVSENDLLRPLFDGSFSSKTNISMVMKDNFEVIDSNLMLEKVTNALSLKKTVLISREGQIVDILTDIDVLNYISSQGQY